MPNIAQVLKEEIRRLAKKEAKASATPLKKDVVRLKKIAVQLRRELTQLKRDNALLLASEKRRQARPVITPEAGKARITSKGIRALRKKLGLSQKEFARLLKVSAVTVYLWESKGGALRLRDATRAAILGLRGMGAREAKQRLALRGK